MQFFVHIGVNKTGSSSLQRYLYDNREELIKETGLIYPTFGLDYSAHHNISRLIKGASPKQFGYSQDWKEDLTEEIKGAEGCIFSSEDFASILNPEPLSEICSVGNTKIIIYVREHVRHAVSWYQQAVQGRNVSMSLNEFIRHYRISYCDIIDRWSTVFGEENVLIRLYDRSHLKDADIISDFLSVLDPRLQRSMTYKMPEFNPSISGNLLFTKRVLNCFISDDEANRISNEITSLGVLSPRFTGKYSVPLSLVKKIRFLNKKDRIELNDRYNLGMRTMNEPIDGHASPSELSLNRDFKTILQHSHDRNLECARLLDRLLVTFGMIYR